MKDIDFSPKSLRLNILNMAKNQKSGHLGCAFSLVEIISVLYDKILNFDSLDMESPQRDFLGLSKGHGVMALYSAFKQIGWMSEKDVENYLKEGSTFFGLSEEDNPGIEISGGSLGHGLPVMVGMAFGLKRKNRSNKCFCIVGDGELNEGSMWEAITFAGHNKLDNLVVLVDNNKFQAMGETKDIIHMNSMKEKFESFGFDAHECDGHSLVEIEDAISNSLQKSGKPSVVICNTIKGAGISFMENNNIWHYFKMNSEEEKQAFEEVNRGRKVLEL